MDSKNTIAAIALSSAVIVLYSLFFVPEKSTTNQNLVEKEKIEHSTDTPSLEQKDTFIEISRKDALAESERVDFENSNVIGSISLNFNYSYLVIAKPTMLNNEYTNIKQTLIQSFKKIK